jgi:hypothetical protein
MYTIPNQLKPWEEKPVSKPIIYLAMFASAFLLIVFLVSFPLMMVSIYQYREGTGTITPAIIVPIVFLSSLVGLIYLFPITRKTADFVPSYDVVPVSQSGHFYEVKFKRYLWGRSLRGKGVVQFRPEGLHIQGNLEPSAWFQLMIVFGVSFVPLFIFGVALGLIPALFLAYYLGKKQVDQVFPYSNFQDMTMNGRTVKLLLHDIPKSPTLIVSSKDAERFYTELSNHQVQRGLAVVVK